MNSSGLRFRSIEELQSSSSLSREITQKLDAKSCDDVYKSMKSLVKQARDARGDIEMQYQHYMRAAELASMIKKKRGFVNFKNQMDKQLLFHSDFEECVTKLSELQPLLSKKYDEKKLREDKIERASSIDSARNDETKENEGPHVTPRHIISPKELIRMVEMDPVKKSAIIFDYRRNKSETISYPNENLITIIQIPYEMMQTSMIFSTMHQKLDISQRTLLNRLPTYDYVVLMEDESPQLTNGEPPVGTKASIMFKALTDYIGVRFRPRERPMFMDGGFQMWKNQYPIYTQGEIRSSRSAKTRDELDDAIQKYHHVSALDSVSYPDLAQANRKPTANGETSHHSQENGHSRMETTFFANGQVDQRKIPSPIPPLHELSSYMDNLPTTIPTRPTAEEINGKPFNQMTQKPQLISKTIVQQNDTALKPQSMIHPNTRPDLPATQHVPPAFDRSVKPNPLANQSQNSQFQPATHAVPLTAGLGKIGGLPVLGGEGGYTLPGSAFIANTVPTVPPRPRAPILDRSSKPPRVTPEREASLMSIYEQMTRKVSLTAGKKSNLGPGMTGLYNIGNTCFMSAVLQCLFQTPQLCDVFSRENFLSKISPQNKMGTEGVISAAFAALSDIVWNGQLSAINPQRFLELFADEVNSSLADGQQHDSSEFMLFLLDALHEDTNQVVNRISFEQNYKGGKRLADDANDFASKSKKFSFSPVNNIFNLQTVSELQCKACSESSATFEESTLISVELTSSDRQCSLDDCLKSHFSSTTLDGDCRWNCPRCKRPQAAVRRTKLWTLPPVLVIHLKRFSLVNGEYVKNTTPVSFETSRFDPSAHVHQSAPQDKATYRLYAVTNHSGRLNSGHYTAVASHLRNGKWLRFDDESVSSADVSSLDYKSAYILFYKKQ